MDGGGACSPRNFLCSIYSAVVDLGMLKSKQTKVNSKVYIACDICSAFVLKIGGLGVCPSRN